jgi:hypothetical protein
MYPVFTDGAGSLKSLYIDNVTGPLSYVPSTSTLSCANLIVSNPIITSNTAQPSSGQLGYIQTATFTALQTLANNTLKNLGSITLSAGTWFVILETTITAVTVTYKGYSIEISSTSSAFDSPADYSFIQETYPNTTAQTSNSSYNTRGIFSSTSSFTLYGNIKVYVTGIGPGKTIKGDGSIQAIRIA